ncbi:MAG TPA: LysR family transcriptional regulator [Candidatus Lachnoclostridium stercorigallinarum]|uniref:LysR family transcriptional regulator n=1 Tax=Candidatus Lachnoclostridium stercorigallinarum TaxID=2838634 RepID=A0A9D2GIF1_9FIRM|nr:LysR family transcriptional regulator [Candidatus Lachnoclostridium stercorigallinarum]
MEFREIATFLQAAQLKSFSKAAKKLDYSQGAVTIQIKHLEAELGVRLFDRIGKQISLTHQGELFYRYAVTLTHNLEEIKDAMAATKELTGTLALGTIESLCSSVIPPILSEYHRSFPEVSVSITIDSPRTLLEMMDENALDIVYFLDKRVYDRKWIKVLEEPEEIVFTASSSHPFAGRKNLELDEVISQPFLLTEKAASYRSILDAYLAASGKKIRPFLEIGNTDFILQMLRENTGLSLLPLFSIRDDIDKGTLTALDVKDFHMQTWRQVVYHKDKWVTREMQEFLNLAGAGRKEEV